MCILQHKFEVEYKDGKKVLSPSSKLTTQETLTSTLLDYGDSNGYSSMAKLVGIPCGVAAQQVLDGVISTPGVLAPMNAKINGPLIETLKKEGIECKEEVVAQIYGLQGYIIHNTIHLSLYLLVCISHSTLFQRFCDGDTIMPGGDYFVWYVSFCAGGERVRPGLRQLGVFQPE